MAIYSRLAGRPGHFIDLKMRFYHNGILSIPDSVNYIDIYRGFVRHDTFIERIQPVDLIQTTDSEISVQFLIPTHYVTNQNYIDVWNFTPSGTGDSISQYGRFWVYEDVWITDDELRSIRFGFEPLDKKFRRGEIRNLEVSLWPLPKYDYQFNQVAAIMAQLTPEITIYTSNGELISGLNGIEGSIGVRQGYNLAPHVCRFTIDTRLLLRGTYKYLVKLNLANSVIISDYYYFMVN